VRDHRRDPAPSRGVAVGPAGVTFVADDGARLYIGADVEQGFEMAGVGGLAAGQVEGDDRASGVRCCMDFRGEADGLCCKFLSRGGVGHDRLP